MQLRLVNQFQEPFHTNSRQKKIVLTSVKSLYCWQFRAVTTEISLSEWNGFRHRQRVRGSLVNLHGRASTPALLNCLHQHSTAVTNIYCDSNATRIEGNREPMSKNSIKSCESRSGFSTRVTTLWSRVQWVWLRVYF